MKKIFACDQFAADEKEERSLASITPEMYLKTMLSCIENGELHIAQKEDDVSVELAADLTDASYVKRYHLIFIKKILTDSNVKNGTIVIYTAIINEFTQIQNEAKLEFGFASFYHKAPALFNRRAIEFFYDMLAKYGVKEVNFYEIRDQFIKHYGYFKVVRS